MTQLHQTNSTNPKMPQLVTATSSLLSDFPYPLLSPGPSPFPSKMLLFYTVHFLLDHKVTKLTALIKTQISLLRTILDVQVDTVHPFTWLVDCFVDVSMSSDHSRPVMARRPCHTTVLSSLKIFFFVQTTAANCFISSNFYHFSTIHLCLVQFNIVLDALKRS